MLKRLKTATKIGGRGNGQDESLLEKGSSWARRGNRNSGAKNTSELDQFRVLQQAFFVRGDVIVDVHQARGIRPGNAGDRSTYCVVLVDGERVGETTVCPRSQTPVWNQPVRVAHETIRQAADRNLWPVPFQPLAIQVWERGSTSDALIGSVRVSVSNSLRSDASDGWHRLVGTGDQAAGDSEPAGKVRVMVHWESETFADSPKDEARAFLRDIFPPTHRNYQHLYYGMQMGTFLAPPPGEEVLLEMMAAISRYDPSMGGYGKSIEGMLVLTELRLLFLPDISCESATASFVEFHTVQVYLAAIRSFSHRGLEGGSRLLSVSTRDGRSVHFRMPAAASSVRCGAWYDVERSERPLLGSSHGEEELWQRGLWGATTSEEWMERVVDEIRWRKAQGNFVALWCKLVKTSASSQSGDSRAHGTSATGDGKVNGSKGRGGTGIASSAPSSHQASMGLTATTKINAPGDSTSHEGANKTSSGQTRGNVSDGCAALERDLERVGVQGIMTSSYTAFGRQNWEIKTVNKDYALVPTYPQTLAFPSSITPAQLTSAAPQRSRNRLPALVWLHPTSRAPLVRSSQPMAGMTTKVLSEDIFLLKQIRVTLDATKISIVDARSLLNAKANQVTGKGFEDVADIGRDVATLEFMGIENIHVVRDSLAAFSAACHTPGQDYLQAIGASGWLKHLAQIMKGAAFVVDEIQRGVAVLVHCSDGWDRTSQLTALAQLYLDPYYRTLEGFEILVEKEWCSFGHMFGLRAHSDSQTESSPVFLQWLDAVWQLVRQYPAAFEFTGHYLERLVEGLYSAGFITFSGNCEKDRREKLKDLQEAGSGGISIFAYLREHAMEGHITAPLVNPLYRPRVKENAAGGSGGISPIRDIDVLRPCCEAQGLEIWQAVYMRDNLLLHHREHQLSVEKGLRLQIYDISRRMDLLEAYVHRLPKGLVKQLVSSAAEMAGDGWYRQQRLVDLASAERETRRAALGGGSSSVAGSGATSSRGRSLQRGSQGNKSNDEGSRSRSRSFNLPMRSWAAGPGRSGGERRQRWASQDSARETDADEDPDMPNAKMDGSDSIHSAASGSKNGSTDERLGVEGRGSSGPGEEELERTARSRSFFSFGRRGRPKMLGTPAVDESEEVERDTNRPGVEGKSREQGDSSRGRGDRRRSASTAAVERRDATGGFDSGRARGLTDASELREAENSVQNSSRVAESGTSASTTGSHAFPYRNSTRDRLVHSKSLRAFDGGSEMSPGQLNLRHARQGTSVEAGRLDDATLSLRQRAMSIAAALERKDGSEMDGGQGGRGDGSSKGASRWTFSRRSRLSKNSALKGNEDESGAGTGSAVEKDKKGIFRTQRRMGDRSLSSSNITFGKSATAPKNSEGHGAEKSASRFGVGSSKEYARTPGGRGAGFSTSKSSAAEPIIHGGDYSNADEEAEARREMLHTIATLEVQLLIKEVVDEACFLASKRRVDDPGMTFKMMPQSSSRSVPNASLPTAKLSERPVLFNDSWSAGGVQRRYPHLAMGEEPKRGLGSRTASAPETEAAFKEASRVVDASSGTGLSVESASTRARRASDASAGGSRDMEKVKGKDKDKDKDKDKQDDIGFFEVLRRKLFEGQDTPNPNPNPTTKVEGGEKIGTDPAKRVSPTAALPVATSAVATAAPIATARAASFASQVPDHPAAPEKNQEFFATRSTSITSGSRVYHGRQTKTSWRVPETKATDTDSDQVAKGMDRGTRLGTSASNPDAGAGGERSTDAGEMISGSEKLVEAAEVAAKFGLVRMVFGDS